MEGFEKEARGGQARREPAAFRSQKKFRLEVRSESKSALVAIRLRIASSSSSVWLAGPHRKVN
jgi:hypothetical protein